ncbi:DUF4349 domain-containing protein [Plantactinospora sp. B5E13]|uniref:DUF4349 domain-containing protein n=1 Tax=Plantactinospora sp. B5E13 TaxID=3153758 RepID=UPI00325F365C
MSGRRSGRGRRLAVLVGAVTVTATLALAGCGADGGDHASGTAADSAGRENLAGQPGAAEPAEGGAGPAQAEPGQPARDPADPAAPELAVNQRAIVYTGSITVRVDDVDAAAAEAVGIAAGAGGFLGGDTRSSDRSGAEATLQLRVPADRFASVVDALAGLGEPLRRDVKTDDVTEETLDLDARIATQQARVESGRRLLAQAKSLSDLVMLESELARREADLASLEAKKRRLADLTALSTITAVLLGPDTRDDHDEEPATGFLAGLKGGWQAFVVSLQVLLTVLGALLPWLVALGLPVVGVVWLVRRLRRRRARPVAPAGPVEQPSASVPAARNPAV